MGASDSPSPFAFLGVLRGARLATAEVHDGEWRLTFRLSEPWAGLGDRLTLTLQPSEPLTFVPWFGTARPLAEALPELELTLTGLADGPPRLVFAARPRAPSAAALAGGIVPLSGAPTALTTPDRRLEVTDLIDAATARIREHLATSRAGDLKRGLEEVLDGSLVPLLSSAGFVAGRDLFVRGGPVTHFIELTRARWSTAMETGFSLGVGACLGTLPRKPTKQQLYAQGQPVILRPLAGLTGGAATGYRLGPDTDRTALGRQLVNDLAGFALPWCEATRTPEALVATLDAEDAAKGHHANAFMAALLLVKLGLTREARAHFRVAEGDRNTIVNVARAHGIELDP